MRNRNRNDLMKTLNKIIEYGLFLLEFQVRQIRMPNLMKDTWEPNQKVNDNCPQCNS